MVYSEWPGEVERFDETTRTQLAKILGEKAWLIRDIEAVVGDYDYWAHSDERARKADRELSAQMRPGLERLFSKLEELREAILALTPDAQRVVQAQFRGQGPLAEWSKGFLEFRRAVDLTLKRCRYPVGATPLTDRQRLCEQIARILEREGVNLTFYPGGQLGRILYQVFAYLGNPPAESTLRDMLKTLKRRMRPPKPTTRQ